MKEQHFLRAGFNLLPYRTGRARLRKRRYCSELFCAAAAGFALAGAAGYGATREAARMAQRQKALERKLAALQHALARMQALTALQLQRGAFTKLLSALAGAAMPEVQLAELNYEAETGALAGVASSPRALGHWLDTLKRMPCFSAVELIDLQRRKGTDTADLTFRARLQWTQPTLTKTQDAAAACSPSQQSWS